MGEYVQRCIEMVRSGLGFSEGQVSISLAKEGAQGRLREMAWALQAGEQCWPMPGGGVQTHMCLGAPAGQLCDDSRPF